MPVAIRAALRPLHGRLHTTIGHVGHTVWVGMDVELVRILNAVEELTNALSMANGAILVAHKQGTKAADLIVKLANLLVERLIFCRVHLDLGLEVRKPLLLALTALESSDTRRD
jgi:hypothetical protein